MLKVQKINKKYKKNKVLNDVSFQIAYGEIVGLLGSNGVGKTTLIKILCGLNRPNSGEIHLDDGCKISVVFDFNGLYMNFNAVENLRIFLNDKTQNKIDEFLKSVGLWEYRDVKVSKYSKGMLRKLSIIRALLTEPNILILDEPFDGIDVENKKFWIEFLRKWVKHGERAVLISSHILSEIEQMCSRTLLMSEGTIKCSLSEEEWKKNTLKKLKYNLKGEKKNIEFVKRKLSKYGCSFEQDGTVWTTELCDVENARMVDKIFEEEELEIIEKYYIHNDLESTYLELMRDDVTTYTL